MAVSAAERRFYTDFGKRIAASPRERGLTEVQLADQLGVTVEELVGTSAKRSAGNRGPASKLQQQLERVTTLPKMQQRFVMKMLDTVLQQHGA